jgi:hypothetical protein
MPLYYRDRGTSGTQLDIMSGNEAVGSLWKGVLSVTAGWTARWSWTWRAGPGAGNKQHGTADSAMRLRPRYKRGGPQGSTCPSDRRPPAAHCNCRSDVRSGCHESRASTMVGN